MDIRLFNVTALITISLDFWDHNYTFKVLECEKFIDV